MFLIETDPSSNNVGIAFLAEDSLTSNSIFYLFEIRYTNLSSSEDKSKSEEERSKTPLVGTLIEKKESKRFLVSPEAEPSGSVLKRTYGSNFANHLYLLQTSAKELAIVDSTFTEKIDIKSTSIDPESKFKTINDFAFVLRTEDLKSSKATSSSNADSQIAVVLDGSLVRVFDCTLSSGELIKKCDWEMKSEDGNLREEFLISFLKPEFFYLVRLWEEENEVDEEEDKYEPSVVNSNTTIVNAGATKKPAKIYEAAAEVELPNHELVRSLDQVKFFLLSGIDNAKPNLNFFYTSPIANSYTVVTLPTEKKANVTDCEFEDNMTIE